MLQSQAVFFSGVLISNSLRNYAIFRYTEKERRFDNPEKKRKTTNFNSFFAQKTV